MHRHVLSDREWNLLVPLLPQRAQTGRPPNDHRTIIDAQLWLAKTGTAQPGPNRGADP
jgi:transposase